MTETQWPIVVLGRFDIHFREPTDEERGQLTNAVLWLRPHRVGDSSRFSVWYAKENDFEPYFLSRVIWPRGVATTSEYLRQFYAHS
jgi:hypothetical protein